MKQKRALQSTPFKIDTNVPIPPPQGRPAKYPIEHMEAGDSFFVPGRTTSHMNGSLVRKKKLGITLVTRTVVEGGVKGCRVWRTK